MKAQKITAFLMLVIFFLSGSGQLSADTSLKKQTNRAAIKKSLKELKKDLQSGIVRQTSVGIVKFLPIQFSSCEIRYKYALSAVNLALDSRMEARLRTSNSLWSQRFLLESTAYELNLAEVDVDSVEISEIEADAFSLLPYLPQAALTDVQSRKAEKKTMLKFNTGGDAKITAKFVTNDKKVKEALFILNNKEDAESAKANFVEAIRQCRTKE
jgi:hypothetical protein